MSWRYGLTGPIGAGKDTIGRLVAELLAPDARAVRVAVGDLVIEDRMHALAEPARPDDPPELGELRGLASRRALDDLTPDARRAVLQDWGRMRRRANGLFWADALEKRLKGEAADVVYVPDVRTPDEFRVLHVLGFAVVELRVAPDVAAARAARRDGRVTSTLSRDRDERVTSGAHLLVADITVDNSGSPECAAMEIAAALRARSARRAEHMPEKNDFWSVLQELADGADIRVDRPGGTAHPKFPEFIYPLDYGYLEGTVSGDGQGIDVWVGDGGSQVVGAFVTADPYKRDVELKLLLGCGEQEIKAIHAFYENQPQKVLYVARTDKE